MDSEQSYCELVTVIAELRDLAQLVANNGGAMPSHATFGVGLSVSLTRICDSLQRIHDYEDQRQRWSHSDGPRRNGTALFFN